MTNKNENHFSLESSKELRMNVWMKHQLLSNLMHKCAFWCMTTLTLAMKCQLFHESVREPSLQLSSSTVSSPLHWCIDWLTASRAQWINQRITKKSTHWWKTKKKSWMTYQINQWMKSFEWNFALAKSLNKQCFLHFCGKPPATQTKPQSLPLWMWCLASIIKPICFARKADERSFLAKNIDCWHCLNSSEKCG